MTAPTDIEDDAETDARIDRYHDGWFARRDGKPRPETCPDGQAGWDDCLRAEKVRVVMPARPEGYYHAPPGTFD